MPAEWLRTCWVGAARPRAPGRALNALQMPPVEELGDSSVGTVQRCAAPRASAAFSALGGERRRPCSLCSERLHFPRAALGAGGPGSLDGCCSRRRTGDAKGQTAGEAGTTVRPPAWPRGQGGTAQHRLAWAAPSLRPTFCRKGARGQWRSWPLSAQNTGLGCVGAPRGQGWRCS